MTNPTEQRECSAFPTTTNGILLSAAGMLLMKGLITDEQMGEFVAEKDKEKVANDLLVRLGNYSVPNAFEPLKTGTFEQKLEYLDILYKYNTTLDLINNLQGHGYIDEAKESELKATIAKDPTCALVKYIYIQDFYLDLENQRRRGQVSEKQYTELKSFNDDIQVFADRNRFLSENQIRFNYTDKLLKDGVITDERAIELKKMPLADAMRELQKIEKAQQKSDDDEAKKALKALE